MSLHGRQRLLLALCAPLLFGACTTLPDGRLWGQDATYKPGWERIKDSAIHAARDPWVWAPLLGAGLFQIEDWDREVSDWAREQTPVFGSQESAEDWSDDLKSAATLAFHASVLATPSGPDPLEWIQDKARGYLVEGAAIWLTSRTTQELKASTDRERPNGLARESFPSGHSSSAAVHARLASLNLDSIELNPGLRRGLNVGLDAMALGTSWARVEAGWHFPSDVLFSIALGNFLACFIHDAFLGLAVEPRIQFGARVGPEGAELTWRLRF